MEDAATEPPPAVGVELRTPPPDVSSGPDSMLFLLGDSPGLDVTVLSNPDYKAEGGSDSGVEAGSVVSGRGGPPSCDSSLVSCCSVESDGSGKKGKPRPTALSSGRGRTTSATSGGRPASAASSASSGSGSGTRSTPRGSRQRVGGSSPQPSTASTAASRRAAAAARTTPVAAFGRCASATTSRKDRIATTPPQHARHSVTPGSRTVPLTSPRGTVTPSVARWHLATANTSTSSAEARSVLAAYATLPRRPRRRAQSPTNKTAVTPRLSSRSQSASREAPGSAPVRRPRQLPPDSGPRSLPPYPRRVVTTQKRPSLATDSATQTDPLSTVEEVRQLEARVRLLTEGQAVQQVETERLTRLLQRERELRAGHEKELSRTLGRVNAMLGQSAAAGEEGGDSLQDLEERVQASDHIVLKQQQEIAELQALCTTLQKDLDKSLAAQKTLLQQQQEQEAESLELQEFLQAEKSTLAEALRDAEAEISRLTAGLQQSQEECKHLVRISEQRRQENMSLGARSEQLLVAQGAAVSGAAVQLSGLGARLEAALDQLVAAYNISEKDLEDVIFHNEAYSKSESSLEDSPEHGRARARHTQTEQPSFIATVIGAIRRLSITEDNEQPAGEEMEEEAGQLQGSTSLRDLSRAILERQQSEDVTPRSQAIPALALVDQIVEADNLLTRLLKVLRIVQLDRTTETDERASLEERLRQQESSTRNWEATSEQLRAELQRARDELAACTEQLEHARRLQRELWQERREVFRQWLANGVTSELSDTQSLAGMAVREVQRQYDTIDAALETLQTVPSVVAQCPPLARLQQDLEDANFRCLTTLPLLGTPDVNANATLADRTV